jgi:tetratricopeptide (TPR) repeat protein
LNNIESGQEQLELALAKMKGHEISAALAMLNEHIDAKDVRWLEAAGECCYRLGDFKQAVSWWEQARESRMASGPVLKCLAEIRKPSFQFWMKRLDEAIDLMERKNFPAALERLQELKLEQDCFVSLYELLGLCYLANGDRNRARQAWNKGLEIDKSHQNLLGYISATTPAAAQSSLPRVPPAVKAKAEEKKYYSRSWQILAGAACLMAVLGVAAWHQNSIPAASQMVMQPPPLMMAEADIMPAEVLTEIETKIVQQTNPEVKADSYEYGEEAMGGANYDRSQARHYYERGYKAYREGDLKNASSNLGMVVAMGKQDYLHREAQYYLARTAFLLKDYSRAERLYSGYLALFPNSNYYDDSLFYLGWVYYELGKIDKARECFIRLDEQGEPGGYQTTPLYIKIMKA